jgi:anti-sigma factor RsiW
VNCRETEELLGAYHEGELEPACRLEVEAHVSSCPSCTAALRGLRAVSAVVKQASLGLAGPIAPRAGRWPLVLLAAAACVAAFVVLGTTNSRSGGQDTGLAKEVVSAHVRSLQAGHLLDIPSPDWHSVKLWFTGKLDFAPDVTPPVGFELVGGRLDYLDGRGVAALIYHYRQHTINLFTWPTGEADEAPASETMQGFHLLHWIRGGMNWWAVSDLAGEELKRMAG